MGCFSYMCKISGKPALSTSSDGSPVHIFLLKDGKVLEHMYGNYDSYGSVFTADLEESFKWKMDWGKACNLHFNNNPGDGFALILAKYYVEGEFPTTKSLNDPNQGWGKNDELLGDTSTKFKRVDNPFHKIY